MNELFMPPPAGSVLRPPTPTRSRTRELLLIARRRSRIYVFWRGAIRLTIVRLRVGFCPFFCSWSDKWLDVVKIRLGSWPVCCSAASSRRELRFLGLGLDVFASTRARCRRFGAQVRCCLFFVFCIPFPESLLLLQVANSNQKKKKRKFCMKSKGKENRKIKRNLKHAKLNFPRSWIRGFPLFAGGLVFFIHHFLALSSAPPTNVNSQPRPRTLIPRSATVSDRTTTTGTQASHQDAGPSSSSGVLAFSLGPRCAQPGTDVDLITPGR